MRATRTFEPDPSQVLEARRFVASALDGWRRPAPDLSLLVSELATNAVLHARGDFAVTVIAGPDRVRLEVSDGNSRLPSLSAVPSDAYSGRGLMLVQALAAAWGVESHTDHGKTIWCEVWLSPRATVGSP